MKSLPRFATCESVTKTEGSKKDSDEDSSVSRTRSKVFTVIDSRRLERECFIRAIELLHQNILIFGFRSIEDFLSGQKSNFSPDAIILNIGSRLAAESTVADELRCLVGQAKSIPVVVLAEAEDLNQVLAALDCGARGYIPASVGIDAIIEATTLTSSGGVFLTSECLAALRNAIEPRSAAVIDDLVEQLTSRQAAVAEALRRGKPNKIIAYELSMCESTVKVHIRTILKKLGASNRTEAAFKLNAIHESRDQVRNQNASDGAASFPPR